MKYRKLERKLTNHQPYHARDDATQQTQLVTVKKSCWGKQGTRYASQRCAPRWVIDFLKPVHGLAVLLLLATSCLPIHFSEDGTVTLHLEQSGLDVEGNCEAWVKFRIDAIGSRTIHTTRLYETTCQPHEHDVEVTLPFGLYEIETWAVDRAKNVSPDSRYFGWFYRAGYDSSFSIRKDGRWLICKREWPNTFQGNQNIQLAWTTDGVLGEWQNMGEDSLNVNICPKNTVHIRMCYSTDIWSIAEQAEVHREYATKKRVVQIQPFWFGELE